MPKARTFERYGSGKGPTRAFIIFKRHQTEINDMYWSFRGAGSYTEYIARKTAKPEDDPQKLFHASGPDARRLPPTVKSWSKQFSEFSNWVRLAAVMSMSAYLEFYLRNVITLAMQSDPLIRFGSPHLQDGTVWLKRSVNNDLDAWVTPCLMGERPQRAKNYQKLFGSVPREISENLTELDALRRVRNSVGHEFGRQSAVRDQIMAEPVRVRVSEKRLVKWLALVELVARAVDGHLSNEFIGEFESILFYHKWKATPRKGPAASLSEARALQKALGQAFGSPPSQQFCQDLIAFYKRC